MLTGGKTSNGVPSRRAFSRKGLAAGAPGSCRFCRRMWHGTARARRAQPGSQRRGPAFLHASEQAQQSVEHGERMRWTTGNIEIDGQQIRRLRSTPGTPGTARRRSRRHPTAMHQARLRHRRVRAHQGVAHVDADRAGHHQLHRRAAARRRTGRRSGARSKTTLESATSSASHPLQLPAATERSRSERPNSDFMRRSSAATPGACVASTTRPGRVDDATAMVGRELELTTRMRRSLPARTGTGPGRLPRPRTTRQSAEAPGRRSHGIGVAERRGSLRRCLDLMKSRMAGA